jgi:hypothetical protein
MDSINETIEKHGNVWKVFSKKKINGRRKLLGTHPTREKAVDQFQAIESSKSRAAHEAKIMTYSEFINERKKESINPAYLTKDAAEMKSEIKKNAKKSDEDPTAYTSDPKGGWKADYSKSGKRYKTKPSKYTKAFAKKYGLK